MTASRVALLIVAVASPSLPGCDSSDRLNRTMISDFSEPDQGTSQLVPISSNYDEGRVVAILSDPKSALSADDISEFRSLLKDTNASDEDRQLACAALFSHLLNLPIDLTSLERFAEENELRISKVPAIMGEYPEWIATSLLDVYYCENDFMNHGCSVLLGIQNAETQALRGEPQRVTRATISWRTVSVTIFPARTIER